MRKPILCRLGLHKLDRSHYVVVKRRHWPSKKSITGIIPYVSGAES